MVVSIYEALHDHRYVYFGFDSHPTKDNPWQATPMMCYSDNLVKWEFVSGFPEIDGLRDGFVKQIGEYYYVIGTGGFYKTNDFISFEKLGYIKNTGNWKDVWAPEIVKDADGKYFISFCAGDSASGVLDDYVTNFDPSTDTIDDANIKITFDDNVVDNSWRIDPDIIYFEGNYYLALGGNYLFKSDQIWGPYQQIIPNFAPTPQKYGSLDSGITNWVEGPQIVIDGNAIRLFADQTTGNGLVYRSATTDDWINWSDSTNTHAPFKMRHGCILVNDKVSAESDENKDNRFDFDHHIYIQGIHSEHKVAMTCFLRNSFNVQYEDNETNEITFTAYNDHSQSYSLIANESLVYFNNDIYIIKSVEEDHSGYGTYSVTALQYVNSEIGRVIQRNVRRGVLTYTVQQVLDFFLNDAVANPFGFSYTIHGDFDKQQIENLGNASGKDMISKIVETWPGTIIYPVGKRLDVYSSDAFKHSFGRRIVYIQDTSDIKLTEDSTTIVNQVRCIGATKDEDQDKDGNGDDGNSGDGNANPANVTTSGNAGNLDGPEGFAKSPVNATWGVDKNKMFQTMQREGRVRAWGVDLNRLYDTVKSQGISPEWFLAYEWQEGYNARLGWLNHTAPHGDPYSDAIYICNWIKQWAYKDHLTPAWWASEGHMVPSAGLEQRWNQEFPKGSIGRLYLQGTAAAVWELAGQVINPYIGKPLSGCVNVIRSWGGHTMKNGEVENDGASGGGWTWPFPSVGEGHFMSGQLFGIQPGGGFRINGFHDGLDFGAYDHPGAEVHAVHGGTVTTGPTWGGSEIKWYVVVTDSSGLSVEYQEAFSNAGLIHVKKGDTVKPGDVIGIRDGTHVHIGITHHSFPEAFRHAFSNDGTWLDPLATIKNGILNPPQEKPKVKVEESDDTSQDDPDADVQYYFEPFIVSDQHSIDTWGLHPGPDVQDDRFKDANAMKAYAEKQLIPDPVITIELTLNSNEMPIPGETRFLTIPHEQTILGEADGTATQDAYNTTVTVVGYSWYPFDKSQGTDITFNNVKASILRRQFQQVQVDKLASLALDKLTQIYYSTSDPSGSKEIKNGGMWIQPIENNPRNRGENSGGNKSNTGQSSSGRKPSGITR